MQAWMGANRGSSYLCDPLSSEGEVKCLEIARHVNLYVFIFVFVLRLESRPQTAHRSHLSMNQDLNESSANAYHQN